MIREDLDIMRVEDAVARAFIVDKEVFYKPFGKKRICMARHFLWLVLHDEYGMSHREISKHYGRSKRMIEIAVSRTRFSVSNQRQDKGFYEEIKNLLGI